MSVAKETKEEKQGGEGAAGFSFLFTRDEV